MGRSGCSGDRPGGQLDERGSTACSRDGVCVVYAQAPSRCLHRDRAREAMPALWSAHVSPVLQGTPTTQSPMPDANTPLATLSSQAQNHYHVSDLSARTGVPHRRGGTRRVLRQSHRGQAVFLDDARVRRSAALGRRRRGVQRREDRSHTVRTRELTPDSSRRSETARPTSRSSQAPMRSGPRCRSGRRPQRRPASSTVSASSTGTGSPMADTKSTEETALAG